MTQFQDKDLSKGHLRKLEALRKSLGPDIADEAFGKWLAAIPAKKVEAVDKALEAIRELVEPAVLSGEIKLSQGKGIIVRRGRGRVIVERVK